MLFPLRGIAGMASPYFFFYPEAILMNFVFFLNSVLFGIGLAMDAFSVSMANGLNEPKMPLRRMGLIAGTFAVYQILMPLIGWVCVHTIVEQFKAFERFIPWIALILLAYIGGKMVWEGIHPGEEGEEKPAVGFGALMVQGIATSIDALSVGFTIAELSLTEALVESFIIGIVTLGICLGGLKIGKVFGNKLAGKASILGGVILIAIGIEVFVSGIM